MTGIAAARRWVALVVLGLGASLLAIVGPSAVPASATTAVVQWPSDRYINPDAQPFVVGLSYSGEGSVWLDGEVAAPQQLQPGDNTVLFGPEDGTKWLVVKECPTQDYAVTCPTVSGASAHVYRSLHLSTLLTRFGPNTAAWFDSKPYLADEILDVEWEVLPVGDPSAAPLLSGSSALSVDGTLPPIGANDVLVDEQSYLYRARLSGDVREYGELEGTLEQTFVWAASIDARIRVFPEVVYPVRDDYVDYLRVKVFEQPEGPETLKSARVEVFDADGLLVGNEFRRFDRYQTSMELWWDGKLDGVMAPEGEYDVLVTVRDTDDNVLERTYPVVVSHKEKTTVRWTKTFRAAPTVVHKTVGRCSALKKPARSSWPGSLGYRSDLPCAQPDEAVVATTNGVYVPSSPFGEYEGVRVTVNGGKARGERDSYLVLYYLDRQNDWTSRTQLSGRVGAHRGPWLEEMRGIHEDDNGPYVIWSVGLAGGAKYDVKSFTVEVKREVLR